MSAIDAEGSLLFRVSGPLANLQQRLPTEGYYFDAEGVDYRPAVNVLLHVVEGKLHELEVYKDDGSAMYPSGVDRLASFWRYRDFALLRVDLRAQ